MIISQLTCGFKGFESLEYVWSEMEKAFLINIYVICATCQLIGFKSGVAVAQEVKQVTY